MKKRKKILNDTFYAKFLRFINPGWSYCTACGKPWNYCKNKTVKTSDSSGTFATCDKCWDKLSLEDLKICYTETYRMQVQVMKDAGYEDEKNHTLEHLLECVEKEFIKTSNIAQIIRIEKVKLK